jgi:hypothetical protein
MSSVQIVFPKLRLATQLRVPGGKPVCEAIEAAERNLAQLAPECLEELRALLAQAEACLAGLPSTFEDAPLRNLYAVAARAVGLGKVAGAAAADTALISLCDLLDHLLASQRMDVNSVAVHVRALRLLVGDAGKTLDEAGATAVMEGLKKVSARYAGASGSVQPSP